ncbi:MAG: YbfB/YjiJ family MFS transporter [Phycisphaerales bacterium]|nr:YbfB/YjiJ family MFS transporter [Phycisphaerales bacterium]
MTTLSERTWYRVLACTLGMLASIGLVRYAYSPLVPAMIDHHWLSSSQVGYLGTVNFIGNVIGAFLCAWLSRRFTGGVVCRVALLIGLVSVGLSAIDFGPWWLAGCRLMAGLTAAGGMILTPALVAQGVRHDQRAKLISTVFAGSGLGVILLSLTLPLVAGESPALGWLYTAALTLACLVIAWPGLKTRITSDSSSKTAEQTVYRGRLVLLGIAYLFAAAAIVPHSIYLAAYIHVVLKQPISFSMMVYAIYGLGIMLGGPLMGSLVSRFIGRYLTLVLCMIIGMIAALMILFTTGVWVAVASGLVIGIAQMGYASIVTQRVLALAGPGGHIKWWSRLTILFNISMAAAAFAMGYMIHLGMGYLAGFWMAAGCFAASMIFAFMVTIPKGINSKV